MSINTARYGLITNEFRYGESYNATTDARYSKAREMVIESHLDLALITGLLTALFGVVSSVRRRFIVNIKGTTAFSLDSFVGGAPARYFNAPEVGASNLACIVTRATIDEENDETIVELWG